VALNDVGYRGPLSVEWEDIRMDRVHGATEAARPSSARWTFPRARSRSTRRLTRRTSDRGRAETRRVRQYPHAQKTQIRDDRRRAGRVHRRVHRIAAAMDGKAELVAGAFSSDAARSKASGADLFLDPSRVYGSYRNGEGRGRHAPGAPAGLRRHRDAQPPAFRAARLFLESGFNVVCDKPVTFDLAQARKLRAEENRPKSSGKVFRPHPQLHRQRDGEAGPRARARRHRGHDPQGRRRVPAGMARRRLSRRAGQKQASWRTDPKRSGAGGLHGRHRHPR
jgi:hypothetical protein